MGRKYALLLLNKKPLPSFVILGLCHPSGHALHSGTPSTYSLHLPLFRQCLEPQFVNMQRREQSSKYMLAQYLRLRISCSSLLQDT